MTRKSRATESRADYLLLLRLLSLRYREAAAVIQVQTFLPALPDADFDRQKITFLAILKPSGDFYFFPDRQTISCEFLAILGLIWPEEIG